MQANRMLVPPHRYCDVKKLPLGTVQSSDDLSHIVLFIVPITETNPANEEK